MAEREDMTLRAGIRQLQHADGRQLAIQAADYYVTHNKARVSGRVLTATVVSVRVPFGPLFTAAAIVGDARFAVEQGGDPLAGALGGEAQSQTTANCN
jgi:hypothetical protein